MKSNLVIKASAGTGKTFEIATRFIRLLVFGKGKVRPETILGLTFSKAAAQEIYEKILNRLREAAASEQGALKERDNLTKDLDPVTDANEIAEVSMIDWTPAMFAGVLRRVIDAQGHDTIATLDSFILRIVCSFPVEMGFQKSLSLLDDYGKDLATADAVAELVASTGGDEGIGRDFSASQDGKSVRSGLPKLRKLPADWRGFFADHPEARFWTAESMRKALGLEAEPATPDLSVVHVEERSMRFVDAIREHVGKFNGSQDIFPSNKTGEIMRYFVEHPLSTAMEPFKFGTARELYSFDCGAKGAEAIRSAVHYMVDKALLRKLNVVAAKISLFNAIDGKYEALARGSGRLSFSDFTDSLAEKEPMPGELNSFWKEDAERQNALLNLQFRLDSEFDHWALDEFQDTSMSQWACLRPLVEAAADDAAAGSERSVLAVGDLKQSIYTWRGGNDKPFLALEKIVKDRHGASESRPMSYRYGKNAADFVNAVFGPENVEAIANGSCAEAVGKWKGECWPEGGHKARNPGGYVELIGVTKATDANSVALGSADMGDDDGDFNPTAAMRVLAQAICERASEMWLRHEADRAEAERGGGNFKSDGIAILVRGNADGLYLAERMRAAPYCLPVVWEGESGVLDSPVVRAILDLLTLAEHPEDKFAWSVVNGVFPIREIVFADEKRCEHPAEVSAKVAESLSRLGLARTLQDIVSKIKKQDDGQFAIDERTAMRLDQLVREGAKFEERPDAGTGVKAFRGYLQSVTDREIAASPDVIRILTIHRSKGLTLDHVIVPIAECGSTSSLLSPKNRTRIVGDGWVFESLSRDLALANEKTAKAWDDAANGHFLDELRTWYVALTRSVKSMRVFMVVGERGEGAAAQFRDLLLRPFGKANATEEGTLYSVGEPPSYTTAMEVDVKEKAKEPTAPWEHRDGRDAVNHETPSANGHAQGKIYRAPISSLFDSDRPKDAAAKRGTDEHAAFAEIERIDPAAPKDNREKSILDWGGAWREAFVLPVDATVWREQGYEIFDKERDEWETGQFDRVVFRIEDGVRAAEIYDFKTNRRNGNESVEAFERRMRETYEAQMAAYRSAISRLCGIEPRRISSTLLLTATGTAVKAAASSEA